MRPRRAPQRELPLGLEPYRNAGLFSGHFLGGRLSDMPWFTRQRTASRVAFDTLTERIREWNPEEALANANEEQTEEDWIRPVLQQLGHHYLLRTPSTPAHGSKNFPDYALFATDDDRELARDEVAADNYSRAIALAEGKFWDRDLDRRVVTDRDYLTNANPAFQTVNYLIQTGRDWGILTNGRLWRLYYRNSPQPLENFFETDLVEVLRTGGFDQFHHYFWGFFSMEALRPAAGGRHIDSVLSGSRDYAVDVGSGLRTQVFQALTRLAAGFIRGTQEPVSDAMLREAYENSLIVLYRLLFAMYAEARGLLPLDTSASYRDQLSLFRVAHEIADRRENNQAHSSTQTLIWSRLMTLWRAIDEGDLDLHVPLYDGELFDPTSYPYLAAHDVPDAFVADAIDLIARTPIEGVLQFVDYRQLSVAHLGTVYEGLLEHELVIADDQLGPVEERLVLRPQATGRRQTGSYYTPDRVVQHIVRETLGPLIADRTPDEILELRIVDPAMGSGHFLVAAVDYLALAIATSPAVAGDEDATRAEETLDEIKRRVVEHCVWGVDLNPLAVELAKLSLWLATASADKPLSFLDHRLRLGNSLLGARVADLSRFFGRGERPSQLIVEDAIHEQMNGDLVRLRAFEAAAPDTHEGIEERKRLYAEISASRERLRTLLDLAVATAFGDATSHQLAAAATFLGASDDGWETQRRAIESRIARVEAHEAFHWELEFPEVFQAGGFDACVGNPPYVNAWEMTEAVPNLREALKALPQWRPVATRHWDLFVLFIALGGEIIREDGYLGMIVANPLARERYAEAIREKLLAGTFISVVDFGDQNVFEGVARETMIFVWQRREAPEGHEIVVFQPEPIAADVAPVIDRRVPQELWNRTPRNVFRLDLTVERFAQLVALDEHWKVKDICYVAYGAQISSAEAGLFGRAEYLAMSPAGMEEPKRLYEGRDMRRYAIIDKGHWLDYRPDVMYGPRTPALFESPKLSVRYVSGGNDSFLAWVDEAQHYYTDHLVIHAVPWHYLQDTERYDRTEEQHARSQMVTLWFLLGVLMSDTVVSYYRELYATGSLQGDYSHVYPETVKLLPIPRLEGPIADPPDDWQRALNDMPTPARAAAWMWRRFGGHSGVAAVLSAATRRRQEIAFEIIRHENDFLDWMHATVAGNWRWPGGESLETPPTIDEFNERLQGRNLPFAEYTNVRDTFLAVTREVSELAAKALVLEAAINAATARLFRE
jgi:TaqI-like C-terminal specificity domain/Eco57I restriction-modification methylase/N-6 DNA Methylase